MKKSIFRSNKHFYHANIDCFFNTPFRELNWIFIQKKTSELAINLEIEIHSLVMMDTHIHLLIAGFNNKENFFTESLAKSIQSGIDTDHMAEPVLNYSQYLNTYKYIYRNPIEANLCENAEHYPYSSLSVLLGRSTSHCQIIDHIGLIQNPARILNWINSDSPFKTVPLKNNYQPIH